MTNNTDIPFSDSIVDPLPNGVTFVSANTPGGSCTIASGAVTCDPGTILSGGEATATIVVDPTQCGTFRNGASYGEVSDSTTFTVTGCSTPTSPPPPPPPPQPVCPPASQELGNEAESGNVTDTFSVESTGDSSNQTAAPLDFGNSGSLQNAQGVLQICDSESGDAELQGSSMDFSPALDSASNQGVGESSGANG